LSIGEYPRNDCSISKETINGLKLNDNNLLMYRLRRINVIKKIQIYLNSNLNIKIHNPNNKKVVKIGVSIILLVIGDIKITKNKTKILLYLYNNLIIKPL